MKLPIFTTLATLTTLIVAHPVNEVGLSSIEGFSATNSIARRTKSNHFCNDDSWKVFNEFMFTLAWKTIGGKSFSWPSISNNLNPNRPDPKSAGAVTLPHPGKNEVLDSYIAVAGQCKVVWCYGQDEKDAYREGVEVYICGRENGGGDAMVKQRDIADAIHDAYVDCTTVEPEGTWDAWAKRPVPAFHIWAERYDLHVEGRTPGHKCPGVVDHIMFPRPDAFNYYPYSNQPKPS